MSNNFFNRKSKQTNELRTHTSNPYTGPRAYWVFYGADKGIEPPEIHGNHQEDGHTTDKLNRVINALYAAFIERNGIEPMPQQLLKERKTIIKTKA